MATNNRRGPQGPNPTPLPVAGTVEAIFAFTARYQGREEGVALLIEAFGPFGSLQGGQDGDARQLAAALVAVAHGEVARLPEVVALLGAAPASPRALQVWGEGGVGVITPTSSTEIRVGKTWISVRFPAGSRTERRAHFVSLAWEASDRSVPPLFGIGR